MLCGCPREILSHDVAPCVQSCHQSWRLLKVGQDAAAARSEETVNIHLVFSEIKFIQTVCVNVLFTVVIVQ